MTCGDEGFFAKRSIAPRRSGVMLARLFEREWGEVGQILQHKNGSLPGVALSVGPDSDAAAYYVDGVAGQFGGYVLSLENPWIGPVNQNTILRPWPASQTPGGGDPNPYLFRASVIVWETLPSDFPVKRRPLYKTFLPTAAEITAQEGFCYQMVQQRRMTRLFVDATSMTAPIRVRVYGVKSDVPQYDNEVGIDSALVRTVAAQLPSAMGEFIVSPGESIYRQLNNREFGLDGCDWLVVRWNTDTAGAAPRGIQIQAFD